MYRTICALLLLLGLAQVAQAATPITPTVAQIATCDIASLGANATRGKPMSLEMARHIAVGTDYIVPLGAASVVRLMKAGDNPWTLCREELSHPVLLAPAATAAIASPQDTIPATVASEVVQAQPLKTVEQVQSLTATPVPDAWWTNLFQLSTLVTLVAIAISVLLVLLLVLACIAQMRDIKTRRETMLSGVDPAVVIRISPEKLNGHVAPPHDGVDFSFDLIVSGQKRVRFRVPGTVSQSLRTVCAGGTCHRLMDICGHGPWHKDPDTRHPSEQPVLLASYDIDERTLTLSATGLSRQIRVAIASENTEPTARDLAIREWFTSGGTDWSKMGTDAAKVRGLIVFPA